jgi:hypothetical protein
MNTLSVKGLSWICALFIIVGRCPAEEFYANDEDTLAQAIADAAASGDAENFINLDRASIGVSEAVVINGGFGPARRLTIRPRPGLSQRPRTQIRSINGAAPIVEMLNVGYVTLQDLDLLRTTFNRTNVLEITGSTNVVVERCRVGSISSSGGLPGTANISIQHPVRVVVRNTICFAFQPGTFDRGIVLSQVTASEAGLWLYNNLVADHRLYGLDLTAAGDSILCLRNNVVVNHAAAITPEPAAYRSSVSVEVMVISSHNTAFASALKIEQQDGAQVIAAADQPDFLRLDRHLAMPAFAQTRWNTQPAAHPNWNLFRLRDDGPLHRGGGVLGVTVDRGSFDPIEEGNPHALDIAVTDDIEKDARPSEHGGASHTDRGADQFRSLTAGDSGVDLRPRLPGLEPVRLSGGGFEVIAVGPQSDFPVVETVMRRGNYTAGGRISGIAGMAFALPRSLAPAIRLDGGSGELKLSWPVSAEAFVLEESAAIGGGAPDSREDWKPVAKVPIIQDDQYILVIDTMATGNRFYRLRKSE